MDKLQKTEPFEEKQDSRHENKDKCLQDIFLQSKKIR